MEHTRDGLAPLKKPSGSSPPESGQAQTASDAGSRNNSGGGGRGGVAARSVTSNNIALCYIKEVKRTFQDDKEKYRAFLYVMKDYKDKRIDTDGIFQRVKELFRGYDILIAGFTFFLPDDYKM